MLHFGHIHKPDYNSEQNQTIIYPGSTISMGFDELGKHGFIVGSIENKKLQIEFVPADNREFSEIELDVTNINDIDELIQEINNLELKQNYLYKVILTGKRKFEIEILDLYKIINKENIIKIKDETKLNYNLEEMMNDYTLKGIFIKEFLNEKNNQNYTEDELDKILEIALTALDK